MTELEQQLSSALQRLQADYQQQFKILEQQLNAQAEAIISLGDDLNSSSKSTSMPTVIKECLRGDSPCNTCVNAMFTNNGQKYNDFMCLISRNTSTVASCNKFES